MQWSGRLGALVLSALAVGVTGTAAARVTGIAAAGGPELPWSSAGSIAGFGQAVAVVGDEVLVGEPRRATGPGLVFRYRKEGSSWAEIGRLSATDRVGDGFGHALAAAGSTLLVGAVNQSLPQGASAYVYERTADGWRQAAHLVPEDTAAGSFFGYSVAIAGDVALVGAPLDGGTGAVHVFRRNGTGEWVREAKLTASDGEPQAIFGVVLAFDGDDVLITSQRQGVYAFRYENGTWRETGKLQVEGVQQPDQLGRALLVQGDEALASAPGRASETGRIYRFRRDAAGWTLADSIAPAEEARQRFGVSLAAAGTDLWIGATRAGTNQAGAVLMYRQGTDGAWSEIATLVGPESKDGDSFGGAIAASGGVVAIGVTGADHGTGRAAVFEASTGNGAWTQVASVFSEEDGLDAVVGAEVACAQGKATQFACGNVDLLAFMPIKDIGGGRGINLNDIWGWTDPETRKEYALVGRMDGTSFVDISNPSNPVYVGDLPLTEGARANSWRDIKVYENHAFIVADGAGAHGVQVFDLARLREFAGAPITFDEDAHYDRIHSAHNIVINEESGFAYVVGSSGGGDTCGGGLHMVDVREPKNPQFAGCFSDTETGTQRTGYSHDAQCVTYHGPDSDYAGREICIGSNETAISIADVTDKQETKAISHAPYPNVAYTHQGWFSEDQRYFFVNDEGDEVSGVVPRTRTLVWDLTDLDDPQLAKEHLGTTAASDHNLYIRGNLMYQSNYASGLRIIDISNPLEPREIGFFDTMPFGEDSPGFTGSWSNYPFFGSGVIAVSSIEQGLFLLRYTPARPVS